MALKTTNRSTLAVAVNVAARIERELIEAEIWLKRGDLAQARKKLNLAVKALSVFIADNKEELLKSDRVAIEVLRDQVIELMDNLGKKKAADLLDELDSVKRLAKPTLSS